MSRRCNIRDNYNEVRKRIMDTPNVLFLYRKKNIRIIEQDGPPHNCYRLQGWCICVDSETFEQRRMKLSEFLFPPESLEIIN